jgi:hypothetical protein
MDGAPSFIPRWVGNAGGGLEGKGQAACDAALVLGEDKQGAIAEEIGPVAFGEQVAQIEQGFKAARSIAAQVNGLAKMKV